MEVRIYQNRKNEHKYLEVRKYECGHYVFRQYMEWKSAGVKNPVGSENFQRIRKVDLDELVKDYRFLILNIK